MTEVTTITAPADWAGGLLEAVNTKKPTAQAVAEYKRFLHEVPDVWRTVGDLVQYTEQALIDSLGGTALIQEGVRAGIAAQRAALGYATASPLERLLIDQIALYWFQAYETQRRYAQRMAESISLPAGDYWERRLSAAQGRYLRAIETLARVRKLSISVQINVATAGGQQVNMGGVMHP